MHSLLIYLFTIEKDNLHYKNLFDEISFNGRMAEYDLLALQNVLWCALVFWCLVCLRLQYLGITDYDELSETMTVEPHCHRPI